MRIITFRHHGHDHAGVVSNDRVVSLKQAGFADVITLLAGGREAIKKVDAFLGNPPADAVLSLESVKLMAPVPRPPKLICIGLNYRDHAKEAAMEVRTVPAVFAKYSNTVIASGDNIVLPRNSQKVDYEAELAFVIGKRGRHIKADDWRDHVFGYTNFHDVSARDFQMATSQWTMGKNFDTFGPMGPWLVGADEIPDPHNLNISLTLNGEKLQNANTRDLIFRIPDLVEFLSSVMTLEPGDVIATGTPSGVGFSHKPPKWLTPGADVVVRIDGLGELRNKCVAEE
jgi:2-keto-4-pentenoate hydratase/2-oxohepta-3-ene-1,7-dioic acid hydratase in catechol pathway